MTAAFAFTSSPLSLDLRCNLRERRDDLPPVGLDQTLGLGNRRVDVVLGHAERLKPPQLLGALADRPEDREAIDDLVRDVVVVVCPLPGVPAIVVVAPALDVRAKLFGESVRVVVA